MIWGSVLWNVLGTAHTSPHTACASRVACAISDALFHLQARRREQLERGMRTGTGGATGKGGGQAMSMTVPAPDNERPRFMGGGFSLAQLPG